MKDYIAVFIIVIIILIALAAKFTNILDNKEK